MSHRFGRSWVAALLAAAGLPIAGCGASGTGHPIVVEVLNDGSRTVELQPSCGVGCNPYEPAELGPGQAHRWHTIDGEPGILSFGVHIPHNRSLGCLLHASASRVAGRVIFRVSRLEECVS